MTDYEIQKIRDNAFCSGYNTAVSKYEKQIQIDAEQIRALQKQNGELTDKGNELEEKVNGVEFINKQLNEQLIQKNERCSELEAQIEKMKCCYNCKHSRTEYEHCKTDKHEKWEIKEND